MMSHCRFNEDLSIEEIIIKNSGQTKEELLQPEKDPYLQGLDECGEVIRKFTGKKITIVADYDCDGILAGIIMKKGLDDYFKDKDIDITIRYPKRFSEGYGISMKIINEITEGLVITVDNGIAAAKEIKAAKDKGLIVVVTDHHLPPASGELPICDALLDPKADKISKFKEYCGAALAYRLIKTLISDEDLLNKLVVFAGIATVADVVLLHGDNRNIVNTSCYLLENGFGTKGLRLLYDKLNMETVTAEDYGFKFGPIINASGRLEDDGPNDVAKLLSYDNQFENEEEITAMNQLADLLIKRNEMRKEMVKEAIARIQVDESKIPIIVYDKECSAGIIGIVAGELSEKYHVPALVFSGEKIVKGSGRTQSGVNLKEMLDSAADVFIRYGGHAGAAGMTARLKDLPIIQERCAKYLEEHNFQKHEPFDYVYDKEIRENEVQDILKELQKYEPFGNGNPAPEFKIGTFVLSNRNNSYGMRMGSDAQHIKLFGETCDAVGFNMADKWNDERVMDLYGSLSWNVFRGNKKAQINISGIDTYKENISDFQKELSSLFR